jgi:serine/threonine-protein kinase
VSTDSRIATLLGTLQGTDATLQRSPHSTVMPPRTHGRGRRAWEVLKGLTDAEVLVEEGVLGQGGMGVVTLARQVGLDRLVAVKSLKPGTTSQEDVEALLSEAWLTGALEHPNILPLYGLTLGTDGRPRLVMKRIEGHTWARLLADDDALAVVAPRQHRLEAHVRILIQVCNALHFAHARGVVHRDLKPDNVMVGAFGEVYVVDWGIATAPGPTTQLAGTPAYMAPEMLGEGADVTVRTDVYLLGSVLFEMITGRPPHAGSALSDVLASVVRSTPEFPTDAPAELVELTRRCMATVPANRPATALDVRLALESFLKHQGSRALAVESQARLSELQTLLARETPESAAIATAFSAARFGFQQALRSWPENPDARLGLQRSLEAMARYELKHGTTRAAEALVAELTEVPVDLRRALEAARELDAARAAEVQRLAELARQHDPRVGEAVRIISAMGLAALWVLSPALGHFLSPRFGALETVGSVPVALISVAALLVVKRLAPPHLRTQLNSQLTRLLLFTMSFQAVVMLGLFAAGVAPGVYVVPLLLGYWGFTAGLIGAVLEPRVLPSMVGYWVAMALALRWPDSRYLFSAGGNFVVFANLVVMLRKRR